MVGSVSKTIGAQNIFSDSIELIGKFNVSISGIVGDTVVVQRSFDNGTLWKDRESYTSDDEVVLEEPERGVLHRIGVKTGGYGTGTILARLSQ